MEMIKEPEFWVAVSFVLFIGVLVYVGAHKKITQLPRPPQHSASRPSSTRRGASQRRGTGKLLAEYQRKQREAESEAAGDHRRRQGRGRAGRRRGARPRWKSSSPAAPSWPRPRSARPRRGLWPMCVPPRPMPPSPPPRRSCGTPPRARSPTNLYRPGHRRHEGKDRDRVLIGRVWRPVAHRRKAKAWLMIL